MSTGLQPATSAADAVSTAPDPRAAERRSPPDEICSWIWILVIEIGLCIVFSVMNPSAFLTVTNIRNIFSDSSILLVMGIGMTFVIITAGIDLSIGSVLVFSSVIAAKCSVLPSGSPQ